MCVFFFSFRQIPSQGTKSKVSFMFLFLLPVYCLLFWFSSVYCLQQYILCHCYCFPQSDR